MSLGRYTPEFVNHHFTAAPEPPAEPGGDRISAAVLWCDISGFTPLTEKLVEAGPEGVEALTRHLNAYYGKLIEVIQSHGGDIIQFEGDATLSLWRSTGAGASLADVTLRATQCSLAIQEALANFGAGEDRLSQRVAVGVGSIRLFWVGGVLRRWTLVAAGEPLNQVQAIDHDCEPGECVLSAEAWSLVKDRCAGQEQGPSTLLESVGSPLAPARIARATIRPESEDALRIFTPGAVLSSLKAGQSAWLAELRTISALFVQLPTLDSSAADIVEVAQQITEQVQRAIYRWGGSINKVSMADKGATVLCGFGVPPLAHEDDPLRAVRAALDIVERIEALGIEVGVGVTTGQCFCGLVGSEERAEYTTLGRTVNLASRLMQVAKGSVIVDEPTFRASEQRLVYDVLPPRRVKGIARPVAMFRPTGDVVAAARRAQTEVIGRREELDAISERLQRVLRERSGSLLVFNGEAGIGKSRIVTEAVRRAQGLDVTVLMAEALGVERDTPYYAWRGVLPAALGLRGSAPPEKLRARVVEALGGDETLTPLAPLLNALLPLGFEETPETAEMQGEVRATNLTLVLAALLRRVAKAGPVMLVIEDAHWFDSASWAIAQAIVQEVDPLFVLLATRPIARPLTEYTVLLQRDGTTELTLGRLSIEETVSIVCQRLGVTALPDEVRDLLLEKADGNPFFSEELAYALRDSGHLLIDDGLAGLRPGVDLTDLSLPTTVQGAVISRLDRLQPQSQLLLKVASVIGREFVVRILRGIYDSADGEGEVTELLPPLVEGQFLLEDEGAEAAYLFKHALAQAAIYGLMLFAQRRGLHRAVAEWLEGDSESKAQNYPLLAHHWFQADEPEAAAEYSYQAGRQALRRFANKEAVRFLSRALALYRDHPKLADGARLAEIEEGLCEAHFSFGDMNNATAHACNTLAMLGTPVAGSLAGRVLGLFGALARRVWQARFGRPGLPGTPAAKRWRAASRLGNRLAELAVYAEDNVGALYHALRQLNAAHAAGPSPELGRAYSVVSTMLGTVPLPSICDVWTQRAFDMAQSLDAELHKAWIFSRVAVYDLYRGQWTRMHQVIDEAIEITERLNDRRVREEALVIGGFALLHEGQLQKADARLARLAEVSRGSGNPQGKAWGALGRAQCLLRFGRPADALELCDDVMPWISTKGLAADKALGHSVRALARLRMGDLEGALADADIVSRDYIPKRPAAYWAKPAAPALVDIYAAAVKQGVGDRQANAQKLAKAVKCARTFGKIFPFGEAAGAYAAGVSAEALGRRDAAISAWQRAAEIAERRGSLLELGLSHRSLAGALPGGDPRRASALQRAESVLRRIGAQTELKIP